MNLESASFVLGKLGRDLGKAEGDEEETGGDDDDDDDDDGAVVLSAAFVLSLSSEPAAPPLPPNQEDHISQSDLIALATTIQMELLFPRS